MKEGLTPFIIAPGAAILEALRMIDQNTKGFLVSVDSTGCVEGTLTDGDIRRAFLKGQTKETLVSDISRKDFSYLLVSNSIADAVEMFKNQSIKFIPILDEVMGLANIITKPQLHALLLQDLRVELDYDFGCLDEGMVDYEIYQRPWGFYKTTVMNEYFQSKIICVNPGAQLSLQVHNYREEHWIVAHGTGTAQIGESLIEIKCGSSLFIPKGCRHRLSNTSDKDSLIITEVQIGEYFGEDDIIRYEDVYGRI